MYLFVAGLILVLVGSFLVLRDRRRPQTARRQGEAYGRELTELHADRSAWASTRIYGIAAVVLGLVLVLLACLYRQDPGEAKVIRNFGGGISHDDTTAGLSIKAPWKSIVTFNIRNQKIEMFGGQHTGNPTMGDDGAAIVAPLKGSSNAYVSITITWGIKPDKVKSIYSEYRDQERLKAVKLLPDVRDTVRIMSARFDPFLIKESRADLSKLILDELKEEWEKEGVVIEDLNLGDIPLDPKTEAAIVKINESRANIETSRNNLETARIDAEKKRVEAKGDADSDQIIRCGATVKESFEEVGGKRQKVTVVTPKSGAACENLLNQQVLTARWIEALKEVAGKGNTIVVTPTGQNGVSPRFDLPLGK